MIEDEAINEDPEHVAMYKLIELEYKKHLEVIGVTNMKINNATFLQLLLNSQCCYSFKMMSHYLLENLMLHLKFRAKHNAHIFVLRLWMLLEKQGGQWKLSISSIICW